MDGRIAESSLGTKEAITEKRLTGVPAFKEWAIICASIERGGTSLIFRKGGIAEGAKGFQFKHRRFFLFPTYFHEQVKRTRLSGEYDITPRNDCVAVSLFVEVEFAIFLRDLRLIQGLSSLHVLQSSVLEERFRYDKPEGLYVAFLRAFHIFPVWELPCHASYGGCRSWVTLPGPPADLKKEPVLTDEEQNRRRSLCLAISETPHSNPVTYTVTEFAGTSQPPDPERD
ncbi:MAG: DUF1802 family protein [Verrucomicrobia bacterium]|nr:DUF1802 family protein [Verrucomicrobiota bacterium]